MWVGLVLFAADYGLIYWGEQFLDSGLTSILFALLPLVTIGFAHLYVPGDRITGRKLAGSVLAFVGIVALFGDRVRLDPAGLGPMLAIVASTVCAAAAGVATKRHGGNLHPASLNAPAMRVMNGAKSPNLFVAFVRFVVFVLIIIEPAATRTQRANCRPRSSRTVAR